MKKQTIKISYAEAQGSAQFSAEPVTYTYVSPTSLDLEFEERVVRPQSSAPLRQRTPQEIVELKKHPFFRGARS
jgi:hypothetical protein